MNESDYEWNLEITVRRRVYTVDLLPGLIRSIIEGVPLEDAEEITRIDLYFSPPRKMQGEGR